MDNTPEMELQKGINKIIEEDILSLGLYAQTEEQDLLSKNIVSLFQAEKEKALRAFADDLLTEQTMVQTIEKDEQGANSVGMAVFKYDIFVCLVKALGETNQPQ